MTDRRASNRVEVREGRRGRSLRIDGTFASWYAPGRTLTDSVWDALAAPLLLLPPARRRSVLVLGLGGGSAARVVRALVPRARIVGVERSREVLRAARRWFDLDDLGVEVVAEDAWRFLERTRRGFDAIIEDIFVGNARTLQKPDWLPTPGLARAARHLRPGGLLVSNTIDETAEVTAAMAGLFPTTLRLDVDGYDNHIVVGGPRPLRGRSLRAAVGAHPTLSKTLPKLTFKTVRTSRPRA